MISSVRLDEQFFDSWPGKPIPYLPEDVENDDLPTIIQRQRDFSSRTFGPGPRTVGILSHIRKELEEIEAAPTDVTEWIDVVILALDGAWRAGHTPAEITAALHTKQTQNEQRQWPDWRRVGEEVPIEHRK